MKRPLVVAEVGINHNGSVPLAKSIAAMAQSFGADYVKFQKRTVEDVYNGTYLQQGRPSQWGTTQRDQKHGLEFTREQYDEIDHYCKSVGVPWFATPMDPASVEFLAPYNLPFIKIASADVTNMELLESIRATGKPVILSTGMSNKDEIDAALGVLGHQVTYLLHCVSSYPTPNAEMNMQRIRTLRDFYGQRCRIGFSNHCIDLIYTVQAYVMGAELLEFHVTLDRNLPGSDQFASMGPTGFDRIMKHVRNIERGWGNGGMPPQPSELPVAKKLRRQ